MSAGTYSLQVNEDLTSLANAIRAKTGGSSPMTINQMTTAVNGISAGWSVEDIAKRNISGSIDLGTCGLIDQYCFYGNQHLLSVTGNSVETLVGNCFQNCTGLATVNFPRVMNVGNRSFDLCSALQTIDLPSVINISNVAFQNSGLTTIIIGPNFTAFGQRALQSCSSLTTVVLRNTTMVNLNNVNNFQSTPFASGGAGGTIYVPSALISTYQADSLWSQLAATFSAIEGSQYEEAE
jgi:hypothetical protein